MIRNNVQEKLANNSRRNIIFSGVALIATCFTRHVAYASGDGGGKDDLTTGPVKEFTLSQFLRLSKNELLKLYNATAYSNFDVKISGFSQNMSRRIVDMADIDRAATRRLLKEMAKIKGNKARKARLRIELDRVTKLEKNIQKSIDRLDAKKTSTVNAAAIEEASRLRRIKTYKKTLKIWIRFPWEGARQ